LASLVVQDPAAPLPFLVPEPVPPPHFLCKSLLASLLVQTPVGAISLWYTIIQQKKKKKKIKVNIDEGHDIKSSH